MEPTTTTDHIECDYCGEAIAAGNEVALLVGKPSRFGPGEYDRVCDDCAGPEAEGD